MYPSPSLQGQLNLNHLLASAGVSPADALVLRHTYTADGLAGPDELSDDVLLNYVRRQDVGNKVGQAPPPLWLNFMADGARRCRFLRAYENHGEVASERAEGMRYFDLRPSEALKALQGRLVIEWTRDPVNWAKKADRSDFPVLQIADPQAVPFPGFDQVLLTHRQLQEVVSDSRFSSWQVALRAVQGIYLIADSSTGQLYVGKADGSDRILARWSTYARDGHGGNVALRQLAGLDGTHREHFRYSLLRVFGPSAPSSQIDEAEAHFKKALLTRQFGLNRN